MKNHLKASEGSTQWCGVIRSGQRSSRATTGGECGRKRHHLGVLCGWQTDLNRDWESFPRGARHDSLGASPAWSAWTSGPLHLPPHSTQVEHTQAYHCSWTLLLVCMSSLLGRTSSKCHCPDCVAAECKLPSMTHCSVSSTVHCGVELNCPCGHVWDESRTTTMTYEKEFNPRTFSSSDVGMQHSGCLGVTKIRKNVEVSKSLILLRTSP